MRIALTLLSIIVFILSLGFGFLFAMDPEGRYGRILLICLAVSALALLANIPIWTLFRR